MVGVYELFQPSSELAALIGEGKPIEAIRTEALKSGFEPLVEDALRKVRGGLTTIEEVARRVVPKFPHS